MNKWKEYFYYDETSPSCLRWAEDAMRGRGYKLYARRKGDVAGTCKGSTGRWMLVVNKEHYLAHVVIWEMLRGEIPNGMVIDHIDRDYTNNKVENLRVVTPTVNMRNRSKNRDNKTGVNGVFKTINIDRKGEEYYYYSAQCRDVNGKQIVKHFPVKSLGDEEAFRLACEYRTKMIEQLNAQGAGYTSTHGK